MVHTLHVLFHNLFLCFLCLWLFSLECERLFSLDWERLPLFLDRDLLSLDLLLLLWSRLSSLPRGERSLFLALLPRSLLRDLSLTGGLRDLSLLDFDRCSGAVSTPLGSLVGPSFSRVSSSPSPSPNSSILLLMIVLNIYTISNRDNK